MSSENEIFYVVLPEQDPRLMRHTSEANAVREAERLYSIVGDGTKFYVLGTLQVAEPKPSEPQSRRLLTVVPF